MSLHYPASQAQVVPAQLDPARYKIPARGRTGTFGFTSLDFKDNDIIRPFNGNRCVVFLQTSRGGIIYYTSALFDWDCVSSLTIPEGDTPQTITTEEKTFRYSFDYAGGGSSESTTPYSTVTPFAGGETLVGLAFFDPVNDGFIAPAGANMVAPPGYSPALIAGSTYSIPGGLSYWGSASGINQTT